LKQRTSFLPPRERRYLSNPWFFNEATRVVGRNKRLRSEHPKDKTIEELEMPKGCLVNEGNIREVKKLLKKAANEEMAPFLLGHLREWECLAKGAEDIGDIDRQRLTDELGAGVRSLAAFVRDWLPSEAKEQLLIELLRHGGEGDAPPIDPRSVLKGFTTFFESRRFATPKLEAAREDALRHVKALAEGIKDWTPYTRKGWELENGRIVFPQMFADGAIPHNVYLVKNAPAGIRTVRRWLSGQQDLVFRDTEVIGRTPEREGIIEVVCTIRLPELILAALSGRRWHQDRRPYLKPGEKLTDGMCNGWLEGEPNFQSMSVDDLFRTMVEMVEEGMREMDGEETQILKRIPIRFKKDLWRLWLEEPRSVFSKCVDTMRGLGVIDSSSDGNLHLTDLGKELCRLEPPLWMTRYVRPRLPPKVMPVHSGADRDVGSAEVAVDDNRDNH